MRTLTCTCVQRAKFNTLIKSIKKNNISKSCFKKLDSSFTSDLKKIKENPVIECPKTDDFCEIFQTPNMGRGVRAKIDLLKNTKIGCYIGPIVTNENKDVDWIYAFQYVFKNTGVDGSKIESMTSLLNHADKPNCDVFFQIHSIYGIEEIHLTFFLNKDVKMGEEIFIDYGTEYWENAKLKGINKDIKQKLITDYFHKI